MRESLRMRGVRRGKDRRPLGQALVDEAVMDILRGQHGQAAVPVLGVVPAEEGSAEAPRVLEAPEPIT